MEVHGFVLVWTGQLIFQKKRIDQGMVREQVRFNAGMSWGPLLLTNEN